MHSWFLDGTHSVPPWTPLYGWYWIRLWSHGTKSAAAELSIPTCKGWEMRFKDGGFYNAFNIVRDQKEIVGGLIRLGEKASSYSEEHDLYCELMVQSLMQRGYLAMGKRLAQCGTIDKPEDIFMLNPDEPVRIQPGHRYLEL
jgi:hypothetical protein